MPQARKGPGWHEKFQALRRGHFARRFLLSLPRRTVALEQLVVLRLHLDDLKQWCSARTPRNTPKRSANRRGGVSLGRGNQSSEVSGDARHRHYETARDTWVVKGYERTAATGHIEYATTGKIAEGLRTDGGVEAKADFSLRSRWTRSSTQ